MSAHTLFQIRPDDDGWGKIHNYVIKAEHRWQLPLVQCGACGCTWGETIAYPAVDLARFPDQKTFTQNGTVMLSEFLRLRSRIQALLTRNVLVPPHVQLGPLVGTTFGRHGDFTWVNSWTPMIAPEALEKLMQSGVSGLIPVPAEIRARGKKPFCHLELQVEPHLTLAERCMKRDRPNCTACGSSGIRAFIEPTVVLSSTIPQGLDLFCIRERPGYVLVTERLAETARRLELTNVVFRPVDVAPD